LIFLKHYDGDPADLALNFTVTQDDFGVAKSVDLIPDGSNIPVTRENRLKYICYVSSYKLSRQIKKQCDAFFDGLSEMIDPKWLRYVSLIYPPCLVRSYLLLLISYATS
jgi:ubiquitin-protein ligase E3 C